MRRLLFACGVFCAVADVNGESYRVNVTRKDANLYRVDGTKTYIKTRYCYEYVYGESAILNYERGSLNNKLIFDERSNVVSCDVEKLLD